MRIYQHSREEIAMYTNIVTFIYAFICGGFVGYIAKVKKARLVQRNIAN